MSKVLGHFEEIRPDYIVVDGDPFDDTGFPEYVRKFMQSDSGSKTKMLWVKEVSVDSDDKVSKELERLLQKAQKWEVPGLFVPFSGSQIEEKMGEIFNSAKAREM